MHDTLNSDTESIRQLGMGDAGAFKDIYDQYWNKLYQAAVSKVRVSENAKEIVQDIFLDLWQRRDEIQVNDLERYLFSAVKYKVLDFFRKEVMRQRYVDSIANSPLESEDNPADKLAFNELRAEILNAISHLPDKTRSIFELNRIEYKSADEIAHLLDIPSRTVDYHITQGLKSLRFHLRDYMISMFLVCSALL